MKSFLNGETMRNSILKVFLFSYFLSSIITLQTQASAPAPSQQEQLPLQLVQVEEPVTVSSMEEAKHIITQYPLKIKKEVYETVTGFPKELAQLISEKTLTVSDFADAASYYDLDNIFDDINNKSIIITNAQKNMRAQIFMDSFASLKIERLKNGQWEQMRNNKPSSDDGKYRLDDFGIGGRFKVATWMPDGKTLVLAREKSTNLWGLIQWSNSPETFDSRYEVTFTPKEPENIASLAANPIDQDILAIGSAYGYPLKNGFITIYEKDKRYTKVWKKIGEKTDVFLQENNKKLPGTVRLLKWSDDGQFLFAAFFKTAHKPEIGQPDMGQVFIFHVNQPAAASSSSAPKDLKK